MSVSILASTLNAVFEELRAALPPLSVEAEAGLFFVAGLLAYGLAAYLVWRSLPLLRRALHPLAFWRDPVVTAVHDGDTLTLSDGRVIRLIGVDTPEAHPCEKLYRDASATGLSPESIMERGRRAGDVVRRLAHRRCVRLQYDWRNIWSWHKGPHGRTLAYVYLLDQVGRKALMLNEEVLRRGLATTTGHSHRYRRRFEKLDQEDWIGGVPRDGQYSPADWQAGGEAPRPEKTIPDVEYDVIDDGRGGAPSQSARPNQGTPSLPGSPAAKAQTKTVEGMHHWLDRHGVPPLHDPSDAKSPLGPERMRASRRVEWLKTNRKELWKPAARGAAPGAVAARRAQIAERPCKQAAA